MERIIKLLHSIGMMKNVKSYTIGAVLEEGRSILKSAGVDTFDIDSRVLLSYVLGLPHHEFFSHNKVEIGIVQYKEYIKLVNRRKKFEPVAQITEEREFWALPFKVSKDTLIPRSDSETVIEAVKAEFSDCKKNYNILDMGTGSGCLLLSLLFEYKNALGVGIDVKRKALSVAKENARKLSFLKRAKMIKFNWYSKVISKKIAGVKFDIIVSNPPYITLSEMEKLPKDVKDYEPRSALYGGRDGLDEYRQIAKSLYYWNVLAKGGRVFLELGSGQELEVRKIFEAFGFDFVRYFNDISGIVRVVEFSKI